MILKIIIFFCFFNTINLFALNQITYISNKDFKKLEILNGKINYYKDLGYPGYGIGFDFKKKSIFEHTDV